MNALQIASSSVQSRAIIFLLIYWVHLDWILKRFSDVLSSYIQRIGTIMLDHLRGKSPRAMKKRLAKECSWNTSRTPLIHLQRQWDDGLQNTNWTICQIHSLHRCYTSQQTIPALPSGAGRGKNRGNARKSLIPRSHIQTTIHRLFQVLQSKHDTTPHKKLETVH